MARLGKRRRPIQPYIGPTALRRKIPAKTLVGVGIPSAEAFGVGKINLRLFGTGIASGEAFGAGTIRGGSLVIPGAGIPSAEAFGAGKINERIFGTGIASGEAFGTGLIKVVTVIYGTGIASAEAFGSGFVNQKLFGTAIASGEAFGAGSLGRILRGVGIASAEAMGAGTFLPGPVHLLGFGIASAEIFGVGTLQEEFLGLLYEFWQGNTLVRTLPDFGTDRRFGHLQARIEVPGGSASATGEISVAEHDAHPTVYDLGTKLLIKDTRLIGTPYSPYIFGGDLRKPARSGVTWSVTADGDGVICGDRNAEVFLVLSYNLDQWLPLNQDPFSYQTWEKIECEVKANAIHWHVKGHTHFRRNVLGQPDKWWNGVGRWIPATNFNYVAGNFEKSADDDDYVVELVGTMGPDGTLTVVQSWAMGPVGPSSFSALIPGNYDMIGFRLSRTAEGKHAKKRWFKVKNLRYGQIATSDVYTLHDLFNTLFTKMGATTDGVAASVVNAAPFESTRVTLGQVADEESVLGSWYWRVDRDASGAKAGVAEKIAQKVWLLTRENSPYEKWSEEQFSHVRWEAKLNGNMTKEHMTLSANNPYPPGQIHAFPLDWPEPPHEDVGLVFAQAAADYLGQERKSGRATFTHVTDPDTGIEYPCTVVKPGHALQIGTDVIAVSDLTFDSSGEVAEAELTTGHPVLDKWLARMQRVINVGRGADAGAIGQVLHSADPKAPAKPTVDARYVEARNGHWRWDAIISWNEVLEDVDGNGTFVRTYHIRGRPLTAGSTNASRTPILEANGGGWRYLTKHVKWDAEDNDTKDTNPFQIQFQSLPNPEKWKWEFEVQAEDLEQHKGAFSVTSDVMGLAFAPPNPTNLQLDIRHYRQTAEWDLADIDGDVDTNGDAMIDKRAGIFKVVLLRSSNSGTTWFSVGNIRKTRSTHTVWHIAKPGDDLFKFQIWAEDAHGKLSIMQESVPVSTASPPTPDALTASNFSVKHGGKHRVTVKCAFAYAKSHPNSAIKAIHAEWQYEKTAPTNADDIFKKQTHHFDHGADTTQTVHFELSHLRAGWQVRFHYQVEDYEGHKSNFCPWSP